MSVARGFGLNGKSVYMNVTKPCLVNMNFTIDSTNGNGLGVRSIKSNGYVENVFMNTSASFVGSTHSNTVVDAIAGGTASLVVGMRVQGSGIPVDATIASITSSSAITISASATTSVAGGTITYQAVGSPNPAAGYCLVQLKQNFNKYLGGFNGFVSPVSGTPILVTTGTTAGLAYIIVSVGTTSVAQWQKLGLPVGVTPAVGVSFVARDTTTATGTGAIEVPSVSGIFSVEAIGDLNLGTTASIASQSGQWFLFQFLAPTVSGSAYDTPMIPTAPANGSVCGMTMWLDGSTVTIDGL